MTTKLVTLLKTASKMLLSGSSINYWLFSYKWVVSAKPAIYKKDFDQIFIINLLFEKDMDLILNKTKRRH